MPVQNYQFNIAARVRSRVCKTASGDAISRRSLLSFGRTLQALRSRM
ncbi:MAG: hypothetical protein GX874_06845 [Smithella sp.]|nr:hypothetical protein [Smithellaceae bacterium]NLA41113.1 hypothetical protein [Smithella sp.]